jgi:hypothetical protein
MDSEVLLMTEPVRMGGDQSWRQDRDEENQDAMVAYYCGTFSFIPCLGILLGPAALVLGIKGLVYRASHPMVGGKRHAIIGIVCGAIVVLGYAAFFAYASTIDLK